MMNMTIATEQPQHEYFAFMGISSPSDDKAEQQFVVPTLCDKSMWKDTPTCGRCDANFSLLRWIHHCRACGFAVCQDCSPARWSFSASTKPQRVCSACNLSILESRKLRFSDSSSDVAYSISGESMTNETSSIPDFESDYGCSSSGSTISAQTTTLHLTTPSSRRRSRGNGSASLADTSGSFCGNRCPKAEGRARLNLYIEGVFRKRHDRFGKVAEKLHNSFAPQPSRHVTFLPFLKSRRHEPAKPLSAILEETVRVADAVSEVLLASGETREPLLKVLSTFVESEDAFEAEVFAATLSHLAKPVWAGISHTARLEAEGPDSESSLLHSFLWHGYHSLEIRDRLLRRAAGVPSWLDHVSFGEVAARFDAISLSAINPGMLGDTIERGVEAAIECFKPHAACPHDVGMDLVMPVLVYVLSCCCSMTSPNALFMLAQGLLSPNTASSKTGFCVNVFGSALQSCRDMPMYLQKEAATDIQRVFRGYRHRRSA